MDVSVQLRTWDVHHLLDKTLVCPIAILNVLLKRKIPLIILLIELWPCNLWTISLLTVLM